MEKRGRDGEKTGCKHAGMLSTQCESEEKVSCILSRIKSPSAKREGRGGDYIGSGIGTARSGCFLLLSKFFFSRDENSFRPSGAVNITGWLQRKDAFLSGKMFINNSETL